MPTSCVCCSTYYHPIGEKSVFVKLDPKKWYQGYILVLLFRINEYRTGHPGKSFFCYVGINHAARIQSFRYLESLEDKFDKKV